MEQRFFIKALNDFRIPEVMARGELDEPFKEAQNIANSVSSNSA